jgi:hypothetical protein
LMKSPGEWDRFMRFMERYAQEHGLGFSQSWGVIGHWSLVIGRRRTKDN